MAKLNRQQSNAIEQLTECLRLCVLCAAECLGQRKTDLNTCIKLCQTCASSAHCYRRDLALSRDVKPAMGPASHQSPVTGEHPDRGHQPIS
ncbi:MAG: hypothetical protein ACT4P8_05500 [Betaproteobacteria bacterium]